jgi:hypothetical protein
MKRYIECKGCKAKLYVEVKMQAEWRAAYFEKCGALTVSESGNFNRM